MTKIVAVVPMRHDSERVPGKNYRHLAGKPLYAHIVSTLVDAACIDEVVVDTDSPVIMADVERRFPSVRLIVRPEHLRAGEISMNEVLLNTLAHVDADYILQTHSTNPFLSSATLTRAVESFLDSIPVNDSAFGVTRLQARLWTEDAVPINHDPGVLLRTQDLPPIFLENSCFYLFPPVLLRQRNNRIGEHPLMVEVPPLEAHDIDEESDFTLAEALAAGTMR
jgi:CMP-N-acetylneuraminic acid synthetase